MGVYSVSAALYYIMGLSPLKSVGTILLSSVLLAHGINDYPCSWGSLVVQSVSANSVFVLSFLCIKQLLPWMKICRAKNILELALGSFLFFTVILFVVHVLLYRRVTDTLSCVHQLLALAMLPTITLVQLYPNTDSSTRQVSGMTFQYSFWIPYENLTFFR